MGMLRHHRRYRDAIVASERANGLLHVIQALSQDLGTQSTILTSISGFSACLSFSSCN